MTSKDRVCVRGDLLSTLRDVEGITSTDFSSPSLPNHEKLFDSIMQMAENQAAALRTRSSDRTELKTESGVASVYIPCRLHRAPRLRTATTPPPPLQPRRTDLAALRRLTHGGVSEPSPGRISWDAIAMKCRTLSRAIEDVAGFSISGPS